MMSLEVTVHEAQTKILRELLFRPHAGYAELQKPTGLTSDHFNFHIARLVELKLVEKVARGKYQLSARGKEYANKMDTDNNTIEKQPKSAVILGVEKIIRGVPHYLLQERRKHPYYGFWGFPSGKIRWGETVLEAAARELKEETGLSAAYRYVGLYHEHAYQQETGELLEDKLFHIIHCTNPHGTLVTEFEGGRNAWLTKDEMEAKEKVYSSADTELEMLHREHFFLEQKVSYTNDKF
jgi:8-oxo-dGTP pyrophosphatase MutT (NUDIX family)